MADLAELREKVGLIWPHLDERARRLFWANEARQVAVFTRGSQPPSWTTPYTGFRVVVSRVAP